MIDWTATIAKADGDETFARTMAHEFIAELPEQKNDFSQAFEQCDIETLRRHTHKLKGGLAFCVVPALVSVVRDLEQACKDEDKNKIKVYYAETIKLIEAIIASDELSHLPS